MKQDAPVRDAVSAGGIVYRCTPTGRFEVVLCGRTQDRLWGLPKGTPDEGETLEDTAIREVQEETGLKVKMGEKVGSIDYWFTSGGTRYHKYVHHWLFEPVGGDLADHDHEFDAVEWVPLAQAFRLVSYQNERRMLEAAAKMLGAGP